MLYKATKNKPLIRILFGYTVCISRMNKINMDKLKQIKNLFKKLIKDEKSVFYAVNRINRSILDKAKKLLYGKYKVFL